MWKIIVKIFAVRRWEKQSPWVWKKFQFSPLPNLWQQRAEKKSFDKKNALPDAHLLSKTGYWFACLLACLCIPACLHYENIFLLIPFPRLPPLLEDKNVKNIRCKSRAAFQLSSPRELFSYIFSVLYLLSLSSRPHLDSTNPLTIQLRCRI